MSSIVGSWRIWLPENKLWQLLQAKVINEAAILACIDAHPEYCSSSRKDGDNNYKYPIHVALDKSLSMDVIRRMLSCYPQVCTGILRGKTLLNYVLNEYMSSEYVILVIDMYPGAVRINDFIFLLFPLHVECARQCRYEVIVKLLGIYPEAISIRCDDNLPLHFALCNNSFQENTVRHLINLYPQAVSLVDCQSRLPLNVISQYPTKFHMIPMLLVLYPDAVCIPDLENILPFPHIFMSYCYATSRYDSMHNYLSSKRYRNVVVEVLDLYPEVLSHDSLDHLKSKTPNAYRCLLNISFRRIPFDYVDDYHDMNWKTRSPLLHLFLQLSSSTTSPTQQDHAYDYVSRIQTHATNKRDAISYRLLACMVAAAGRMSCEEGGSLMIRYDMKGDDLGCMLLRNVMLCL